jgi:hypothetical protein
MGLRRDAITFPLSFLEKGHRFFTAKGYRLKPNLPKSSWLEPSRTLPKAGIFGTENSFEPMESPATAAQVRFTTGYKLWQRLFDAASRNAVTARQNLNFRNCRLQNISLVCSRHYARRTLYLCTLRFELVCSKVLVRGRQNPAHHTHGLAQTAGQHKHRRIQNSKPLLSGASHRSPGMA